MSTHASDGTRTHTGQFLRLVPLPLGYTGRMLAERLELSALRSWSVCLYRLGYASIVAPVGVEPTTDTSYKLAALTDELRGYKRRVEELNPLACYRSQFSRLLPTVRRTLPDRTSITRLAVPSNGSNLMQPGGTGAADYVFALAVPSDGSNLMQLY